MSGRTHIEIVAEGPPAAAISSIPDNASAIISQAAEDVLDNVHYGSFCDSEEIRVAFFLAAEPLGASFQPDFSIERDTTALEQSSGRKRSGRPMRGSGRRGG